MTSVVNPSRIFAPRFATCERTTVSSSQYQQEVLLGDPLSLAIMGAAPSTARPTGRHGPLDEGSGGGHDCEAGGVSQVHGGNQEDREVQQGHQQEPGAGGDRKEATQGRGETLEESF